MVTMDEVIGSLSIRLTSNDIERRDASGQIFLAVLHQYARVV